LSSEEERIFSMRTSVRLTLVACASLVALVFANAAWSAYEPNLLIASERQTLRSATSLVIGVSQSRDDDATAFIDIAVPAGYTERLTATPGTVVGEGAATVLRRGATTPEVVTGQLVAANPADFAGPPNNTCVKAQGPHSAVWLLNVTVGGTPARVPLYIDDGPNIEGVSAHIKLCFASPADTSSAFQLLTAVFEVRNVFTNPAVRALYAWNATFTPYLPNSTSPNDAGAVEARAVVPLPVRVTMKAKRKGRVVTLTGKIDLPGNAIPAIVEIWVGPSPRKLKRVARAKVKATGEFTIRRPRVGNRTRIQYYQARLDTPFANAVSFGHCQTPPPRAPRGCVSATFAALYVPSGLIRARFPRG
jgi:hypothetical protein